MLAIILNTIYYRLGNSKKTRSFMKNKVIISAIIAFFAVAGIAILPNGMNAHALSPEEEERIHLVTIDK